MSIHSSLRSGAQSKKHRSVLKRYERLKVLKEKNLWDEGKSVLGIAKVKMQKLKVHKEKAEKSAEGAPPAGGAPAAPAAGASASAAKSEKK